MIMLKQPASEAEAPEKDPLYHPGQIVRHRRYGYRGVVVDSDLTCKADEAWYQSNQTQPDRNQPWYHVLNDTPRDQHHRRTTWSSVSPPPDRPS